MCDEYANKHLLRIECYNTNAMLNKQKMNKLTNYMYKVNDKTFDSVCVSVSVKDNERLTELVKLDGNFTA